MRLSLKKRFDFRAFVITVGVIIGTEPPVLLGSGKASHSKLKEITHVQGYENQSFISLHSGNLHNVCSLLLPSCCEGIEQACPY